MEVYSKNSLKNLESLTNELIDLLQEDIKKNNSDLHRLCLPARYKIPQFKATFRAVLGNAIEFADANIPKNSVHGGKDLAIAAYEESDIGAQLSKLFETYTDLLQVYSIIHRFDRDNGKIFTLTESLMDRLLDCATPGSNIHAGIFQLPFENIFLEFGNNEQRESCRIKREYHGYQNLIVEGVYISEHKGDPRSNTIDMRKHFGLLTEPYRVIEVGISLSPYSLIPYNDGKMGVNPLLTYFHICIPNDDMPLNEVIKLNQGWLKGQVPEDIFTLVYNAVLYLNLDSRVQKTISMPNEIMDRLSTVTNPNKKKKAAIAASKAYSHIQIGSTTQYRVLSDINKQLKKSSKPGTKPPHARRGYFGIRYVMNDEDQQEPKITWIKNAIIHKELLSQDEIELIERQYQVI